MFHRRALVRIAIGGTVTLVALIGYIITELLARWLTPWAPRGAAVSGRSFRR